MNSVKTTLLAALVSATLFSTSIVFSDETQKSQDQAMPMMQGHQGGMMNQEKMQSMMAMKKKHMQVMETHLANIESLLAQLVELQKKQ